MLSLSSFRQGLLLLVLLSCLAARAAIPIQHWTMASGARVYLVESPSIAMVDLQIDFDGGAQHCDHRRFVLGRPVTEAHAHTAQSKTRYFDLLFS